MSAFWPITERWACGVLAPRATVHAIEVFKRRSLCGIDVKPVASVMAVDGDGTELGPIVSTWPPPAEDRCPECAALTKVGGRQRAGSHSFGKST